MCKTRSSVPEEVNVVDGNGGGWMMQRSLIHAVSRHRNDNDIPVGFLFITDDVLVNTGPYGLVGADDAVGQ